MSKPKIRPINPAMEEFVDLPFEEDDYTWYLIEVHGSLSSQQIAQLWGMTTSGVKQLEERLLRKLRNRATLEGWDVADILDNLRQLAKARDKKAVWSDAE